MPYTTVIFDQDGVLVDLIQSLFAPVDARICNLALQDLTGVKREFITARQLCENLKISGASFPAKLRYAAALNALDVKESFTSAWEPQRTEAIDSELTGRKMNITPYPGVPELLALLYDNRANLAVASSNPAYRVSTILGAAGLLEYFDEHIYGVREGLEIKPAPDIYLDAVQSLGVEGNGCVLIEDSESGMLSAARAKDRLGAPQMHLIGVAQDQHRDFRTECDVLYGAGADIVFRSMFEIKSHLIEKLRLNPELPRRTKGDPSIRAANGPI